MVLKPLVSIHKKATRKLKLMVSGEEIDVSTQLKYIYVEHILI
jgi:hypothetical protein